MAETRSQAMAKKAVVCEVNEEIEGRFVALEKAFEMQSEKTERSIQETVEAFKLMTRYPNQMGASTSEDPLIRGNSPGRTSTQDLHNDVHQHHGQRDDVHHHRGHRGDNHYNGRTRITKIDFPRFSGEKVQEWLSMVEQFFTVDNTPEVSKVPIASLHFDGLARTWHQALVQEEVGGVLWREWRNYKALLKERFEEVLDDPIAELKELKETEGISEYHAKFELIRSRICMSEEYLVSAYLAGLRMDTQMHIRMFHPQSTRQCLVLGRLYEKAHPRKPIQSSWSSNRSTTAGRGSKGLLPTPKTSDKPVKENTQQLRKFLSNEEMSDRRAKGLCYYCDEKFSPEHYLKHKKTQLFMIDLEESENQYEAECEEEMESGDIAQISLNAVSGVTDYTTMRVIGVHGKSNLYILVDSRSTHNFVDRAVANKLGCRVESVGKARVSVADGTKIAVCGKITNFKWSFQGHQFQSDVMVIPLGGHDMVLGVQWLSKLGPITWDFEKLIMEFKWQQKKCSCTV